MAIKTNTLWAIFLIIIILFLYNQPPQESTTDDGIDLTLAVNPEVAFTGQNKYFNSADMRNESVRVIKLNDNGDVELDLGQISLDGGILSTTPQKDYNFYYFMNSSGPSNVYYVSKEEYTQPTQDAVINKMGIGCAIDTSPIFWVKDEGYNTQTSSANAQSIAAGQTKTVFINIKARKNYCYGAPDSPKGNALCFAFNDTVFTRIWTETSKTDVPWEIMSNATSTTTTAGLNVLCYEFQTLANLESVEIPVNILASGTEPTTSHNISVYLEDIAFDLHDSTLAEIYDYNDEYGNSLAAPYVSAGTIYIS